MYESYFTNTRHYIDGRQVQVIDIDEVYGEADFVFEASGIAKLQIELIDTVPINGIYVATGIPAGERPMNILAGNIMQQLVLKNQIILGSVNAGYNHYRMAVDDLAASMNQWPKAIKGVITEKVPYSKFMDALQHHSSEEIKVVVDWTQ